MNTYKKNWKTKMNFEMGSHRQRIAKNPKCYKKKLKYVSIVFPS